MALITFSVTAVPHPASAWPGVVEEGVRQAIAPRSDAEHWTVEEVSDEPVIALRCERRGRLFGALCVDLSGSVLAAALVRDRLVRELGSRGFASSRAWPFRRAQPRSAVTDAPITRPNAPPASTSLT